MDTLTKTQRSKRMALVRGKDTSPELYVGALVRALGWRYSRHDRRLPGSPDLVFRTARKAVFVHGCFWHRHRSQRCKLARLPKTRLAFWLPKLESNARRDRRDSAALRRAGWSVLNVWECQLGKSEFVRRRLSKFLGHARRKK